MRKRDGSEGREIRQVLGMPKIPRLRRHQASREMDENNVNMLVRRATDGLQNSAPFQIGRGRYVTG